VEKDGPDVEVLHDLLVADEDQELAVSVRIAADDSPGEPELLVDIGLGRRRGEDADAIPGEVGRLGEEGAAFGPGLLQPLGQLDVREALGPTGDEPDTRDEQRAEHEWPEDPQQREAGPAPEVIAREHRPLPPRLP